MAVLKFTLSEDGVSVLRDALTCLGKFSDEVSLEAKRDRVRAYLPWCVSVCLMLPIAVVHRVLKRRLLRQSWF